MANELGFCDGMEKKYGKNIPFDPDVKKVIDEGIREARQMDHEKRAQVIETAGYLAYDIMIFESLGDHEDGKVAKGRKEAAEKLIKDELKKMESKGQALKQERYPYAKLLEEAKRAAEEERERIFSEGKPQTAEKTTKHQDLKGIESTLKQMDIKRKRKSPEPNLNAAMEARDRGPQAIPEDFSEQGKEREGDKETKKDDEKYLRGKLKPKKRRKSEPKEGKPKEGDKEKEAHRYRVFYEGVESIYIDILLSFVKTYKQEVFHENDCELPLRKKIDELQTMSDSRVFSYSPNFRDYQAFKDHIEVLKVSAPKNWKHIDERFEKFVEPKKKLIILANKIMLKAWKRLKKLEKDEDFVRLKEYEILEAWPSNWVSTKLLEDLTSCITMINYQNDHGLFVDYQAYLWLKEKQESKMRDFHHCVHVVREMYEFIPQLLRGFTWWAFETSSTLSPPSKQNRT